MTMDARSSSRSREMLTPQQLRGARIAGAWAMPLMAIGFVLAVLPGVVFLLVVLIFALIGLFTGGLAGGLLIGFFAAIFGGIIVTDSPWLIIVPLVVGLAAFAGGSSGSVRALRRLGIPFPRKASWSAFGVGFATQAVFASILWLVLLLVYVVPSGLWTDGAVSIFFTGSPEDFASPLFVREIIFHVLVLAATSLIGVLYWPIFARRMLVREAARQQRQATAEWAAYEYALWKWQTRQGAGAAAVGGCETGGDGKSA